MAEFNRAGKLDVVAIRGPMGLTIFLGNEAGAFRSSVAWSGVVCYSPPVAAGFNRDGLLDLACVYQGTIFSSRETEIRSPQAA